MMETFTPESNSLQTEKEDADQEKEGLTEEEESFYSSIKPALNNMLMNPKPETIGKIMDYSKSV